MLNKEGSRQIFLPFPHCLHSHELQVTEQPRDLTPASPFSCILTSTTTKATPSSAEVAGLAPEVIKHNTARRWWLSWSCVLLQGMKKEGELKDAHPQQAEAPPVHVRLVFNREIFQQPCSNYIGYDHQSWGETSGNLLRHFFLYIYTYIYKWEDVLGLWRCRRFLLQYVSIWGIFSSNCFRCLQENISFLSHSKPYKMPCKWVTSLTI